MIKMFDPPGWDLLFPKRYWNNTEVRYGQNPRDRAKEASSIYPSHILRVKSIGLFWPNKDRSNNNPTILIIENGADYWVMK